MEKEIATSRNAQVTVIVKHYKSLIGVLERDSFLLAFIVSPFSSPIQTCTVIKSVTFFSNPKKSFMGNI